MQNFSRDTKSKIGRTRMPKSAKHVTIKMGHISKPEELKTFMLEVGNELDSWEKPTMIKLFETALDDNAFDVQKRYLITVNGEPADAEDTDNIELEEGDIVLYSQIPNYDVVSGDNLDVLVQRVNSMYPRFVAIGGLCYDGKQYHQAMAIAEE
jgi:hypothetical protein